jgi:hypothetical protein
LRCRGRYGIYRHAGFDASIGELSFDIIPASDEARLLILSGVIVVGAIGVIVATRGQFAGRRRQGPDSEPVTV